MTSLMMTMTIKTTVCLKLISKTDNNGDDDDDFFLSDISFTLEHTRS